jgi:transitional endoplasmic reticulum ATPase
LAGIVDAAIDLAIDESLTANADITPISQSHLLRALKESKATTIEWLTTSRNYAKYANVDGLYDEVIHFLDQHGN